MPRRWVGGHVAGLGMAQKHNEDGHQGRGKSGGARDQPYDQFEVHHGPPLLTYLHEEPKRALAHRQPCASRPAEAGCAAPVWVGESVCRPGSVTTSERHSGPSDAVRVEMRETRMRDAQSVELGIAQVGSFQLRPGTIDDHRPPAGTERHGSLARRSGGNCPRQPLLEKFAPFVGLARWLIRAMRWIGGSGIHRIDHVAWIDHDNRAGSPLKLPRRGTRDDRDAGGCQGCTGYVTGALTGHPW